ncbi:MAG: glucose-1-phosphate cytidylyltransferase [Planctomycetota bacterium]|nr:glucose-1-phosphate cytidylyltransferase [Planctomycetota bacterium]
MNVLILCGGMGTRMREETEFKPKPLVDVGGKPILWHIMKTYAHFGLRRFVLCLGYKGELIKDYFLNYEAMQRDCTVHLGARHRVEYHGAHAEDEFAITLAETGLHSMTGGRVRRAARYIEGDTFMVTYGDGVADIDVGRLLDFHRAHGKLATISAHRPTSRFGVLNLGRDSAVKSFSEKPQLDGWASMGFFVFHRKVLDLLADDQCVLEREPLEALASQGQLAAYKHEGFFFAMDTYREYKALNELWDSGKAPWKVWKDHTP